MIVEPKVKGFICTTAHREGCKESVKRQIDYVIKNKADYNDCVKNKKVLVVGASTGYGLASRIALSFGCDADTLGVMYEKEASGKRTATAGYYNTEAFEEFAKANGKYAKTINGDAFSREVKEEIVKTIKEDMGKVDMIVYSLAAPRRTAADGTVYKSVLKTVGNDFTEKNLNLNDNTISTVTIPAATEEEVNDTIKVMGGEDWMELIDYLYEQGVLSSDVKTIAYSYIGPKLTYPIYNDGTIGQAKKHLFKSAGDINEKYAPNGIKAYVSVNKAIVTQASSAIPIVPLYFSILYKVMKEAGNHENCIEQMHRLFSKKFNDKEVILDDNGLIRMDDYEMSEEIQSKVGEIWKIINSDNINEYADIKGFFEDFYNMFGFMYENIDYSKDILI